MIKKIIIILLLLAVQISFAQIGIGTLYPKTDLDVNGSMLVQKEFNLGNLPIVNNSDEDFKLLTRLTNSSPVGEITVLDVDSLQVAPINVINYKFDNIKLDNLTNVDLQYDANKYIVAISNFRYTGGAIKKNVNSIGAFVVTVFIEAETWHLEIRNRFLELETSAPKIQYYVTLIVYDKSYFKNMPIITTNLNGLNTGTASSIPAL